MTKTKKIRKKILKIPSSSKMARKVTKISDLDRLKEEELIAFLKSRDVSTISSEGDRRRLLNLAQYYFRFKVNFTLLRHLTMVTFLKSV